MAPNLKQIFRHLLRNRQISIISILGLAVGLATSMVLAMYLHHHFTYDSFHTKSDRTYKVISRVTDQKGETTEFGISFGVLKEEYSQYEQVETVVRIINTGSVEIELENERYNIPALYADYEFFRAFDFNVSDRAITRPDQIVISEKLNERFFNREGHGKVLRIGDKDFQVAAIAELPLNTQFQFEVLLPLQSMDRLDDLVTKSGMEFHTYVVMKENTTPEYTQLLAKHYDRLMLERWDSVYVGSNYLLPLADIHLNSGHVINTLSQTDSDKLAIVSIIALLVLALGLINYTNFQIAGAHYRRHEMGMKKILGARRPALFLQIMTESLVTVFFAGALSILLMYLMSTLVHKAVLNPDVFLPSNWSVLQWGEFITGLVAVGVISGTYPAIYLSGLFGMREKLIAKNNQVHPSIMGLVVVQFAVKTALIITIITFGLQMKFLYDQPLGFDRENVVLIRNFKDLDTEKYQTLKSRFEQIPDVMEVGMFQANPGWGGSGQLINLANRGAEGRFASTHVRITDNYLNLFGIDLLMGEDFNYNQPPEGQGFLINETAYYRLFPEGGNPLGEELEMGGRKGPIRGVFKDYHFESLHTEIGPLVLNMEEHFYKVMGIKLNGTNTREAINAIEQEIKKTDPFYTLKYKFLDSAFQEQYHAEIKAMFIIVYATLIAIILSVLGLYALSIFLINTRSKEVAIRKIMGANLGNIFWLLTGKMGKWIFLGLLIGLPAAWQLASNWLMGFTVRIDLWQAYLYILPLTIIVTALVSLLSVFKKLLQAMLINPVDYLKSE
ncbi:MAG: ABC transporter permease [Cyclobacteriaceae bacterium]|nr:ABC transporter permease [Cyclobacteriaceae bacterium]